MRYFLLAAVSYFLGSMPGAWLAGRILKLDLRQKGSGNLGATNAYRVGGLAAGLSVLAFDAAKGLAAVGIFAPVIAGTYGVRAAPLYLVVAGAACMAGHVFPFWLKGSGGKGVATGAAIAAFLAPLAGAASLGTFALVFLFSKIVSLASLAAAAILPLSYALIYGGSAFNPEFFWFFIAAAAAVLYFHKANIGRLARGEEPRLRRRRP